MLTKEMHIEFLMGLQKIGALSRRKFYPEEIDTLLNRAQDQFILDSIRMEEDEHGFQTRQVDVDRVRPLIVKRQLPAEFIETTTAYSEYQVHLPSDYSYLISDNWYQAKDCDAVTTVTVARYYYRIPVLLSVKGSAKYYAIANLKVGTDAFVDLVTDTKQGGSLALYSGYDSVDQKFSVIKLMGEIFSLKKLNNGFSAGTSLTAGPTIHGLYYERYGSLYFPGELIAVISGTGTFHIVIDAIDTSISSSVTDSYTQKSSTDTYEQVTSRLVRQNQKDNILQTKYYQPQKDSPVSTIESNLISLFSHPSRIVNKSAITYIRQPQRIDLALQRNCELAPEFHRPLINIAVEYAAGHIEAMQLKEVTQAENKQ